jgi:GTP-binding protein HflX
MNTPEAVSNERPRERAVLVHLVTRAPRPIDPDLLLDELGGLARAAGAVVAGRLVQDRPVPDAATLIGRGKALALAADCDRLDADLVIVDNPVTPAQARNLERLCGRRVLDRTELILDIFARRARTHEGRLQVELAQLQYRLPRLAGSRDALSRLGGGIGTRGPGETKLETDRRRIRHRIAALTREIAGVGRRRAYLRARRGRSDVPTVALVGYTNAGKTTLFNRLTGARAVASDALFVTLDPLMRRVRLPDARTMLLADTVGFLDRLPHQLVAAFRATLEEVAEADLLLHVIDAGAPDRGRRAEAVRSVLAEVGAGALPVIEVFNKIDRVDPAAARSLAEAHPGAVLMSASGGQGAEALIDAVAARLAMDLTRVSFELDETREGDRRLVSDLYRHGRVLRHVTADRRVSIEAELPRRLARRLARAKVPA